MRESLDLAQPEKIAIGLGLLLVIASWVPRVRLFNKDSSDPVLTELLDDTFPTTFQDLLAFHLVFRWRRLTAESRSASASFVVIYFLAFVLLLFGFIPALVRHFFA